MEYKRNTGFTLVEILIVVAIIALLATIAIPNLLRSRMTANEAAAIKTLRSFATACEIYTTNSGVYPANMSNLVSGSPPPYFPIDLSRFNDQNNLRNGYYYEINLSSSGYTVAARALSSTGNWDYRVTPGVTLKRSPRGQDTWELF